MNVRLECRAWRWRVGLFLQVVWAGRGGTGVHTRIAAHSSETPVTYNMTEHQKDAAKQAAGEQAAAMVSSGMCVGLGTGSTTAFALLALGRRVRQEGLRITGLPTSYFSERLARTYGIPIATVDELERLDIAIDGADEVDAALNLIKGRGAAHTRERVVAALADRFVVLVDASKLVGTLGTKMPVPVEVLPMACAAAVRRLRALGAEPEIRTGSGKDGPVVTDQGFWIIDARFQAIADPYELAQEIRAIPGVLDHGLFLGMATDVLVGERDGQVRSLARESVKEG